MIQRNVELLIASYLTESGDNGFTSPSGYHPHLLDDPELTSGRHRKVLNLASYLVCMHQALSIQCTFITKLLGRQHV